MKLSAYIRAFPLRHILKGDYAALCFAFLCFAASLFLAYRQGGGETFVFIKGKEGSWYYPAESAMTMTVSGPLGDTIVRIENGGVRIISSPCANQTCVTMGAVHRRGAYLACLPNAVLVTIEGGDNRGGGGGNLDADAGTW